MIPQEYNLADKLSRATPRNMMILGVAFLIVAVLFVVLGGALPIKNYYHSYLFSFAFYFSIVFGALFFVVLQHLTRAGWSVVVRRIAEVLMKNIELMIILSIPALFGVFELYHWTHKEDVLKDPILLGKAGYLNIPFFFIRVALYFIVGFFIARFYYRASIFQDKNEDQAITLKMQKYAPLSTMGFALVITFFSLDFLMSLNPHWYSTIWGIYYFAGSMVISLSLIILISLLLRKMGMLKNHISVEHYHDLGKLLFSFNIFWSYIAFSQYMLIWYANIPEETLFYLDRINGSWKNVSLLLVVGHVFLPIIAYISRNAKRNLKIQTIISSWFVFIHIVDMYWIVMPGVDRYGVNISFVDVLNFIGIGLLFFGYFLLNLRKESLIPFNDPRIEESIHFENH